MEDASQQSQPPQETNNNTQDQNTHSTPIQPTEPTHKENPQVPPAEKPVEKPTPAATVAVTNDTKTETHAESKPAEPKPTDPKPVEKQEKTEHKEAEKKEPAVSKPKEEAHADSKKAEHKDEKKEASPQKAKEEIPAKQEDPKSVASQPKEEAHADSKKVEHKEKNQEVSAKKTKEEAPAKQEDQKPVVPQQKEQVQADSKKAEHKDEKKEATPQKAKEETPAKQEDQKPAASQLKEEVHTDSKKVEHKDENKQASPQKAKEETPAKQEDQKPVVHEQKEQKEAHPEPAKKPEATTDSPAKAKEAHVEVKTEVQAHEPEHKSVEVKEAHKSEEKAVASHEAEQSSAEPGHAVTEKSPERAEGNGGEKKASKPVRASTQGKKSPEPRASDGNPGAKDRILEVKKMKQAYEDQLKLLNKELTVLSKQERLEKQVLASDISKKSLHRDPLISQKNSAKLLRPIDRAALDYKSNLNTEEGSVERLADEVETQRRRVEEIKRVNRLKEEPLYLKMEKQFFDKIVCPELEKRKEALKQKREFSKPIELKELKEHAVKYNQVSKKEILHKQMARMERDAIDHEKAEKVINVYKSSMLKHVLEKDEEEKIRDDKKAQERKKRKDRQLQYGKLVKEMYFPKVDEDLRQGLVNKLQAEKAEEAMRRARQVKEPKTDYSGKTWKSKINHAKEVQSTGNVDVKGEYSSEGKSRVEKFLTKPRIKKDLSLPETLPESELPDAVKKINDSLKEKIEKTGTSEGKARENVHRESESKPAEAKVKAHTIRPSPKKKDKSPEKEGEGDDHKEGEKQKKAYTNYLDDVRKKRMEQEKNGAKVKYGHWEKHLKNKDMSYQDKVLNILDDVNRIEHQAKLKEEKLKQHEHGSGMEPVDLEGQVTDMYLESIKAKLALIQGLS